MPTHRYPLSDGREVEIRAPLFNGRAYIYVDGEFIGENTLHELRYSHNYTLPDKSTLMVHVVRSLQIFQLFDVRHNGAGVRRSASDPIWSRRTAIDILILVAISDVVWRMPSTPMQYVKDALAAVALLLAIAVWKEFDDAPSWARKFMFVRCLVAAVHYDDLVFTLDFVPFALYFWMRHVTSVLENAPPPRMSFLEKLPTVTLTSPNAP